MLVVVDGEPRAVAGGRITPGFSEVPLLPFGAGAEQSTRGSTSMPRASRCPCHGTPACSSHPVTPSPYCPAGVPQSLMN